MRAVASKLLPVLIALALVVAAVWVLSARVDDPRVDTGGGAAGGDAAGGASGGATTDGPGGVAAPSDAGALAPTLVAGGRAYLPLPADGLRDAVGADVQGDALQVAEVADGGFLAGDARDRVLVRWAGEAPAAGDVVDVEGVVRAAPEDPRRVAGDAAAARRAVAEHGGYVEADAVDVR